jgi:adenylate cyclase
MAPMPIEIERKFLVLKDEWRAGSAGRQFRQGYLARGHGVTVRVRRTEQSAYLTIKGKHDGITRSEFEYEVPVDDAEAMLQNLCDGPLIKKTRFEVLHDGVVWVVDEFQGKNQGLIVAEVELDHSDQLIDKPSWVGEEVTHDPRFRNSNLVDQPLGLESSHVRLASPEREHAQLLARTLPLTSCRHSGAGCHQATPG